MENEEHCDFVKLREALLRINVDALRERTHNVLYEVYRRDRLREMNMKDGDCGAKMMEAFQQVEFKLKVCFLFYEKLFNTPCHDTFMASIETRNRKF